VLPLDVDPPVVEQGWPLAVRVAPGEQVMPLPPELDREARGMVPVAEVFWPLVVALLAEGVVVEAGGTVDGIGLVAEPGRVEVVPGRLGVPG
jgi:hypothetical protein